MALTDAARALERLGADGNCPSCGKNNGAWLLPPDDASATFTLDTMETLDVQPFICPACGFIRLHAKAYLDEEFLNRRDQHASG